MKIMSPFEKILFIFLIFTIFASSYYILYKLSYKHSVLVPSKYGVLKEGVIGASRFINPLLAVSDTDKDLTALVYSGLLKPGKDGVLVPDLAESYSISDDKRKYTFKLKKNVYFHDGVQLSADDVVYTIKAAQDPKLNSPERANWEGIKVEAIDKYTLVFTLPKAYAAFPENVTLGILPKHIWSNSPTEDIQYNIHNEHPIGSGPYKLENIEKREDGTPYKYELSAYENYHLDGPYIENIILHSYANEKDRFIAWQNGEIDSVAAIDAANTDVYKREDSKINYKYYPRIFAVFFNPPKNTALGSSKLRQALDLAIDKDELTEKLMGGSAYKIDSPIPEPYLSKIKALDEKDGQNKENSNDNLDSKTRIEKINKIMTDMSWKKNDDGYWEKGDKEFILTLSLVNTNELEEVANFLQDSWKKAGFKVVFKKYNVNKLINEIIPSRSYEALLFGEDLGRSLDLYPYWHSSQRYDPGLNLANYKNSKLDKLLEDLRSELLAKIRNIIINDHPAVFLYSPKFIYILPQKLKGYEINIIDNASERFKDIERWYLKTERVWVNI